jgi:valyl-tRNA synthetase
MSKTKGNVVDPLDVINRFGTDATRFTLAAMAAPGTDIAFNESRTDGYRAFANKIWNAARFMFMNVDRVEPGLRPATGTQPHKGVAGFQTPTLEDRWILSRFNRVVANVDEALAAYRFHEAANSIYDFFWGEFCDWYLELIKPRLAGDDREQARTAYENLVGIFEGSLRMLSPFMPFITEEIWHAVYDGRPAVKSIALAAYPQTDPAQVDTAAETEMAILQDLVVSVRNIRAELKVEPKEKLAIEVFAADDVRALVQRNRSAVERLANVETLRFVDSSLAKAAGARSTARFEVRVLYERVIDAAAERERLSRDLNRLTQELTRATGQLSNQSFLDKAPAQVVEGLKRRKAEVEVLVGKIRSALDELDLVKR